MSTSPPRTDCTRPGVPLVLLHDRDAVVFCPLTEIAMLRLEWDGRLEATLPDGRVLHRPGPLDPFRNEPLHEVSPGVLLNPRFVTRTPHGLELPAGWSLPDAPLPPPPQAIPPDPDTLLAATPRPGGFVWLTPTGERPGPRTRQEVLAQNPQLVKAGPHYVHPGAVRRLSRAKGKATLVLEGGHELRVRHVFFPGLYRSLGLPWPDDLADVPASHRPVYELGLRDWPRELLFWSDQELRDRYVQDPRRLVDDVIWEAYRRGTGRATEHRGLYYNPLRILAYRAGILGDAPLPDDAPPMAVPPSMRDLLECSLPRPELAAVTSDDLLWLELQIRLDLFVGDWRLFTYRELGFLDRGAPLRRIGEARPHVVLLVEKSSLQREAARVAERFGASMVVMGGAPTWITTEFFCYALRAVLSGPVLLVSYCDFDPWGWAFPVWFTRQLERYGVLVEGLVRLVKPSCFTPEELERLAVDLLSSPSKRKQVEEWVRETGGVNGEARGLYANALWPVERVEAAFLRETGLEPVAS